ncbi:hypothetical protein G7Y89_g15618 [Cudoniella acicularis]|uniref:DUF2786 domain-containing protein n=1 Tax=Cudoniella acicularis TaxID=354080 RepID=A0A8H4QKA6_9HELO|nr:hypothetical protein G7Y89_g15618 [Cudoniella acicularis]
MLKYSQKALEDITVEEIQNQKSLDQVLRSQDSVVILQPSWPFDTSVLGIRSLSNTDTAKISSTTGSSKSNGVSKALERDMPYATHTAYNGKQPTQRARVKYLAQEPTTAPKNLHNPEKGGRILEHIRKCFARGQHPNTPESEAKASLSMAAKLMAIE